MIRAESLCKRFGKVAAVDDLSFAVQPGEILGFLGPNGAGKSTTLRILSGYLPPTSGRASIAGLDLTRQSLAARRRLGYLPENFSAPPELRAGEYLRFRAALKGLKRGAVRARVAEVAALLGLEEHLRQPLAALSKGYRQRVGLADALLARPPALLLDEPFGGLDPLQRQEFRRLLVELAGTGMAILFSSHVLPEVEGLAGRVLILQRGRARAAGSQPELVAAVRAEARLRLVTEGPIQEIAALLPQFFPDCAVTPVDQRRVDLKPQSAAQQDAIFRWLASRPDQVQEFRLIEPSLEELFAALMAPDPAGRPGGS